MFKLVLAGMMAGSFCFSGINTNAGEYSEARSILVYKTDEYLSDYVTKNSISNVVELEIDPDGESVFLDEIVVRVSNREVFSHVLVIAEKSDGVSREDEHRTIAKSKVGDSEFIVLKHFDLGVFDETIRIEIALVAGRSNDLSNEDVSVEVLSIKLSPQDSEVELAVINMEETFSIDGSCEINLSENIKAEAKIGQSLKVTAKKGNLSLDKIFLKNMGGKIAHGAYLEINDGQYDIEISEIGIGSCELWGTPISEGYSVKIKLFDREGERLDISKYFVNDDDLIVYSSIFSGHRVAVSLKEKK